MIADAAYAASAICVFRRWRKTHVRAAGTHPAAAALLPPANKARAAASVKRSRRPRFVYYRGNLVSVINYPLLSERTMSTSMLSRAVPFALATVAVTVSPALNFEIMD